MVTGMALVDAIREERADPPTGIRTLGLDVTHHWLTHVEPGRVTLDWPVGEEHMNLENAVICSWVAAVGDQALFFASTSVCGEGEATRMAQFSMTSIENITGGTVQVVATILRRVGDRLYGECTFSAGDAIVAVMTATIDVIAA